MAFAKLTGCKVFGLDDDEGTEQAQAEGRSKRTIKDVDGNEVDEAFASENEFLQAYVTLDWELRRDIGYQMEDFIRGCTFKGLGCNEEK